MREPRREDYDSDEEYDNSLSSYEEKVDMDYEQYKEQMMEERD